MNIQNVVLKTGLTKRMVRHYEDLELIRPRRDENGYRQYSEADVEHLLCIKALKTIGFGLTDIKKILNEGQIEEILKSQLQELLHQKQELYFLQKENVNLIKRILKSNNSRVSSLWDQIVQIQAPSNLVKDADGLHDFLKKRHVVRGRIKGTAEVAKIAELGFQNEYQIDDVTYTTYQGIFEENTLPRASLSLCRELYAYILVFTESNLQFGVDFHKQVLQQFSEAWGKVESELTFHFDALTEDLARLENIFSHFDLAVALTAQNSDGGKFQIVIPGQQLVVYLSQKTGSTYNQELWLEK